ncbi:MAG: hypothetical protein ACK5TR_01405 [Alphaproteobacteria bacterium]|jgi:hypothetical protein
MIFTSFFALGVGIFSTSVGARPTNHSLTDDLELASRSHFTAGALDIRTYLALHPDIATAARQSGDGAEHFAQKHFYAHGVLESRLHLTQEEIAQLPTRFNADRYLALNPDVAEAAKAQSRDANAFAIYHYLRHGKYEGRLFESDSPHIQPSHSCARADESGLPSDFNADEYRQLNKVEVDAWIKQKVHLRWPSHSMTKIETQEFLANQDIAEEEAAIQHFLEIGKEKGLLYKRTDIPADFNTYFYFKLNPDVYKGMNRLQRMYGQDQYAKDHYATIGRREGRAYTFEKQGLPEGFSGKRYLNLNPDLKKYTQDRGMSSAEAEKFAEDHYRNHGIREFRSYGQDIPLDFSAKRYLELNPTLAASVADLPENDQLAFAERHYREQGQAQGLPYKRTLTPGVLKAPNQKSGIKKSVDVDVSRIPKTRKEDRRTSTFFVF